MSSSAVTPAVMSPKVVFRHISVERMMACVRSSPPAMLASVSLSLLPAVDGVGVGVGVGGVLRGANPLSLRQSILRRAKFTPSRAKHRLPSKL